MLELSGVGAAYGKHVALSGVDLHVDNNEIVVILGANGAGKSTLLMTICGSPQASAGSIRFEDRDITRSSGGSS